MHAEAHGVWGRASRQVRVALALMLIVGAGAGCGEGCGCGEPAAGSEVVATLEDPSDPVTQHRREVAALLTATKSKAPLERVAQAPIVAVRLVVSATLAEVVGTATYKVVNAGTEPRRGLVFALPPPEEGDSSEAQVAAVKVDGKDVPHEVRNGLVEVQTEIAAQTRAEVTIDYRLPIAASGPTDWGDSQSDQNTLLRLHVGAQVGVPAGSRRADGITLQHALPYLLEPEVVAALRGDEPLRAGTSKAGLQSTAHFVIQVEAPPGWIVAAPGVPAGTTWQLPAARTLAITLTQGALRAERLVGDVTLEAIVSPAAQAAQADYLDVVAALLPVMQRRLGPLPTQRLVISQGAYPAAGFGSTTGHLIVSNLFEGGAGLDDPKTSLLAFFAGHEYFGAWRRYLLATALAQQWWGGVVGIDRYADLALLEGTARELALEALTQAFGGREEVALLHELALSMAAPMARASTIDAARDTLLNSFEWVAAIESNVAFIRAQRAAAGDSFDGVMTLLVDQFAYTRMQRADYESALKALAGSLAIDIGGWWALDGVRSQVELRGVVQALSALGKRVPRNAEGTAFLQILSRNIELARLLHGPLFDGLKPDWEALVGSVIDSPLKLPPDPTLAPPVVGEAGEPVAPVAPGAPGEPEVVVELRALTAPFNTEPSPLPEARDRVNAASSIIVHAHFVR